MKQLLPLHCFFLAPFLLNAQMQNVNMQDWHQDAGNRGLLATDMGLIRYTSDTSDVLPLKPFALINPAPGVHRLPLDNMPCIVPDPDATVAIPNGWPGELKLPFRGQSPRMPNPAKPLIITPSRPLLIKPEIK